MSWNVEFPDMDDITPLVEELEAAGYVDVSWRNDEAPAFERHHVLDGKSVTTRVWIDPVNADRRESYCPYQYGMSIKHSGSNIDYADIGTDSWALMQALIKA